MRNVMKLYIVLAAATVLLAAAGGGCSTIRYVSATFGFANDASTNGSVTIEVKSNSLPVSVVP